MRELRHIAIVGAGIVGVAAAIWLQRTGYRVTLLDRAGPGEGTSFGNGGVLAAGAVTPVTVPGLVRRAPKMLLDPDQPLFLKWGYLPRLAPWLVKYLGHANEGEARRIAAALAPLIRDSLDDHLALSEGTGAARFVHPSDYVFVYGSRAAFEADAFTWGLRRAHGIAWEEMCAERLRAYDPIFGDEAGFAARCPGHGRISDPGAYVRALAAHAQRQGAELLSAEVRDVVQEDGRVTGLEIGGRVMDCDAVVLATGAWSKRLSARLGVDVPIESERGYHLELWEPSAMPRAPVMFAAGKFVATPMEGRLRLAGIVEFGGLEAGPSTAPFELLRRQIRRAMPGLSWAREEEWMGHRPAPADSIPLIGPVPGIDGAYLGFGHHHLGLTAGPRTGRMLAQMIDGTVPNVDVAPYSPSRFTKQKTTPERAVIHQ